MPTIQPDERPMTQTIRANDLEIGYETYGSGPPVVLLHGATSSGRADFATQIPFLAASFRVFIPDARGHGRLRHGAGTRPRAARGGSRGPPRLIRVTGNTPTRPATGGAAIASNRLAAWPES